MAWDKISDTNPFAQIIDVSTDINDPPIARWSVVPMEWAHDGDVIKAAVVAYHHSGINRVEFTCDGGEDDIGAHKAVVSNPLADAVSKQDEYACNLFIDGSWTEGIHTVRAIVYANNGSKRVLQGTWLPKGVSSGEDSDYSDSGETDFTFIVNRGTYDGTTLWVDSISGNNANSGSNSAPLKSLWVAIEKVHSLYVDGAYKEDKIICKKGNYRMSPLKPSDWQLGSLPASLKLGSGRVGWLSIQADVLANKKDVVITNKNSNFGSVVAALASAAPNLVYTRFTKIQNITIENYNDGSSSITGDKNSIFSIDSTVNQGRFRLWLYSWNIICRAGSTVETIASNLSTTTNAAYPEVSSNLCGFATNVFVNNLYSGLRNFVLARQVGIISCFF
jgi:hypothetical protein